MESYEYCNGELSSPIWHSQSALSLPPPPQFCLRIVFNFSRDDCNNREKFQTTTQSPLTDAIRDDFTTYFHCNYVVALLVQFNTMLQRSVTLKSSLRR